MGLAHEIRLQNLATWPPFLKHIWGLGPWVPRACGPFQAANYPPDGRTAKWRAPGPGPVFKPDLGPWSSSAKPVPAFCSGDCTSGDSSDDGVRWIRGGKAAGVHKRRGMWRGRAHPDGRVELELTQTRMVQKPMLRVQVCARALRASQIAKRDAPLVCSLCLIEWPGLGLCEVTAL